MTTRPQPSATQPQPGSGQKKTTITLATHVLDDLLLRRPNTKELCGFFPLWFRIMHRLRSCLRVVSNFFVASFPSGFEECFVFYFVCMWARTSRWSRLWVLMGRLREALESFWGALGSILGCFGGVLGSLLRVLWGSSGAASGCFQGVSGRLLGAPGAPSGASRDASEARCIGLR